MASRVLVGNGIKDDMEKGELNKTHDKDYSMNILHDVESFKDVCKRTTLDDDGMPN